MLKCILLFIDKVFPTTHTMNNAQTVLFAYKKSQLFNDKIDIGLTDSLIHCKKTFRESELIDSKLKIADTVKFCF